MVVENSSEHDLLVDHSIITESTPKDREENYFELCQVFLEFAERLTEKNATKVY